MIFSKFFKVLGLIMLSTILMSCDNKTDQKKDTKPETSKTIKADTEQLKIRALARWNALIESEWTTAYSYQTPSYRKNYTRKQYVNSFGTAIEWRKIEYGSIKKINDQLVDITLILNINFEGMVLPTTISERWQFTDNNWWHIKK